MEDLIVAKVGGNAFPVRNGRQVARRRDGVWFLAYDDYVKDKTFIVLRTSKTPSPLSEEDLNKPIVLAGIQEGAVLSDIVPGQAEQLSIVIDQTDTLHTIWHRPESRDLWYARCNVSAEDYDTKLRESRNWFHADGRTSGPEQVSEGGSDPAGLGDIALEKEGKICVTYHQGREKKLIYFAIFDGAWKRQPFATGWNCQDPTLDMEEDGTIHITFGPRPDYNLEDWSKDPFGALERTGIYHAQSHDGGVTWTHADGKTLGIERVGISGDHPTILSSKGRIWLAFIGGGTWESPGGPRRCREGPTICYSYYDGERWQINIPFSATDPDLCASPLLFMDCYAQPRLYYVNLNRHHTYMSRWMGKGFSKPQESRWGDELSPSITVEKRMLPTAEAFGLMFMAAEPLGEVEFCRVEVPRIQVKPGERVLFLDLWELGEMSQLELRVNTAEKDPHNPVLRPGKPGEWDDGYAVCYGAVLYEDGIYRMWYQGINQRFTFGGVGYATSKDGIHWEKPKLGLYEYKGSKENNICILGTMPPRPDLLWGGAMATEPSLVKDLRELDPNKRYKIMLSGSYRWDTRINGQLLASPDGIHWTDLFSTPLKGMEKAGSLFYDEKEPNPNRRWKTYGQSFLSTPVHKAPSKAGRHGLFAYSSDCVFWTVYPHPVLDPHGGIEGNRPMRLEELAHANDHMFAVYPYRQYYLGIYDFCYESTAMDDELAMSRDGYHFLRVANGQKVIPLGETGEWDAANISKANTLVVVENKILIYYMGKYFSCFETRPVEEWLPDGCTGLARLPLDGWTYLRVRPEHKKGQATTIPMKLMGGERLDLVVKADHLNEENYILAELLDADIGQPISGFSAKDHEPIKTGGDAIRIKWQGGKFCNVKKGNIKIRFHLNGDETRLYYFGFE